MSIAGLCTGVLFGTADPPSATEVILTFEGVEVSDPGYRRVGVVRGTWTLAGTAASKSCRFGPFRGRSPVRIDGAALLLGGERVPLDWDPPGAVVVVPGMTFDFDAVVEVR